MKFRFTFLGLIIALMVNSQTSSELHHKLSVSVADTTIMNTYNELTYYFIGENIDSAEYYNKRSLSFSQEKKIVAENFDAYYWKALLLRINKKLDKAHFAVMEARTIAESNNNKSHIAKSILLDGRILLDERKNNEAIGKYLEALNMFEGSDDKKGMLATNKYLGLYFKSQNETTNALKYFLDAMQLSDELKDSNSIFMCAINLGSLYEYTIDPEKALVFYQRALAINARDNDPNGRAICTFKLGNLYNKLDRPDSARIFLNETLEIHKERNDELGLLLDYSLLANSFNTEGNFKKADENFKKSLELALKHGDSLKTVRVYTYMARSFYDRKDYKKTIKYYKLCLANAPINFGLGAFAGTYGKMALAYEKLGNYKEAYEYHTKFKLYSDSLFNSNDTKKQTELKLNYEFNKVQDKLMSEAKEKELQNKADLEKRNMQRNFLIFGLTLISLLLLVVYRSFRVKHKANVFLESQKQEIQHQKLLVEMKNKEITDSITYAKRIQNAILPPAKVVQKYLEDSFILYKPKDIVAGDFYWLEHKEDRVLFAAADCTGHGVPGAMVSVVCNNALNRSVREHGLSEPGQILDKTREIVLQEFEKSDEGVSDGMDIALCSLKGNELQYAGAYNPLWIIREGRIIEVLGDKQAIGKVDNPTPYTNHNIELQKGDSIYIFSDGYVDQFGGEKGKKFKAKAFRFLLLSIQNKTMDEQKVIMDNTFEGWKGSLEQIDDVCVIGVRV